ncbi:unnamed protein product [Ixodes hexagonus]
MCTCTGFPFSFSVGPYGFEWPEDFDHASYDVFQENYHTVLAKRLKKWEQLMRKPVRKGRQLKRYVRKGIPRGYRKQVWMALSGAGALQAQNRAQYKSLLQSTLEQDLVETIQIADVPRTFPDNIYFHNGMDGKQAALFNVLVAHAHLEPGVGYCQGLNFIAGLLLLTTEDEEASFWLLHELVKHRLPEYYTRNMIGLLTDIEVLSELVRQRMPLVHAHLRRHDVSWAIVTTKWFICLFAEVLPIETVLRVWDCLFSEGSKVLFRVALTLVSKNQQRILDAPGFAEITAVFKDMVCGSLVTDCHSFMLAKFFFHVQAIFREPKRLKYAHIQELRSTCRAKVEEEQNALRANR